MLKEMNQLLIVIPAIIGCYAVTLVYLYAVARAIWHAHHPGQSFWKQNEKQPKAERPPKPEKVKKEKIMIEKTQTTAPAMVAVTKTETSTQQPVEAQKLRSILFTLIQRHMRGEVEDSMTERTKYSRDTSLFTKMPELVVYPKDADDVSELVKAAHVARGQGFNVSITARSAGTDMSGGPLTDSIVAVFTKYMNKVIAVGKEGDHGYAVTEPGAYYRDFEKETLAQGFMLPSYPASRSICAMGGIVNNDSGGERTLEYGKTRKYVEELDVVLSDGTKTTFKSLSARELAEKQQLPTLEGSIYKRMSQLVAVNAKLIERARPHVSKNSAGYALWEIRDPKTGTFNLAKLITGAQGTLALVTSARLSLVKPQAHRAMLIVFLTDPDVLPEIVKHVLPFNPESFESYDDHTLKLAIQFMPQMLSQMGLMQASRLGISFLPEVAMVLRGGVPKLVLMAEFSEDTAEAALKCAKDARASLASLKLPTRIAKNEQAAEKYWIVRRESFALLRKNLKGLYASPFIDDFVVPPDSYTRFLPELNALLGQYDLIYTIAGHIGNGNFHIIPLMDVILELAPRVYDLVIKYGGTTTGEHNDGIIRTPYLEQLFGSDMVKLFAETKRIFDPENIFNPGKKVGGTFEDIEKDMIKHM
jgi:FAD/FMN-containing dehydrogenase